MAKDVDEKLKRKPYEKELDKLQVELCHLQDWVKTTGERIIIVLEGRDAAGKGGLIKAMTARVSPRVFRVFALPAPTDRQKTEMYMQRYIEHFPAAGEIVIFDRSWYNRAGVEYVMGFCTPEQHQRFLELCPVVEKFVVDGGIRLLKIWLEVGQKEQERRFMARIDDPIRQWKLSPMDLESFKRWYEFSKARDMMLERTDTDDAPWYIVRNDDKRRASPQRHRPHPGADPLQADRQGQGQAAVAFGQAAVRRPGAAQGPALRRRAILTDRRSP